MSDLRFEIKKRGGGGGNPENARPSNRYSPVSCQNQNDKTPWGNNDFEERAQEQRRRKKSRNSSNKQTKKKNGSRPYPEASDPLVPLPLLYLHEPKKGLGRTVMMARNEEEEKKKKKNEKNDPIKGRGNIAKKPTL